MGEKTALLQMKVDKELGRLSKKMASQLGLPLVPDTSYYYPRFILDCWKASIVVLLTERMVQPMDKPTVQDIFHRFYPAYLDQYSPSPVQAKVAHNIMNCKTGAYGANVCVCEDCGFVQIHYNSFRNRCCPMCQAVPKEMWMDARREDVLDAPYFHLVFTVPDILNPVIYSNQRLLYDALYHAASSTISELTADPKRLGAKVGYICILHTWVLK